MINKNKKVTITEKKYMDLVFKITRKERQELRNEGFSADILIMDELASMKFALELKQRLFEDYDEE